VLAPAAGVVTVNSTAGLQALREGKPVVALGRALYDMPGLTFQGARPLLDRGRRRPTPRLSMRCAACWRPIA
jgi:capsular polysaccharide export protein